MTETSSQKGIVEEEFSMSIDNNVNHEVTGNGFVVR